jgi:hypothetical protein
MQSCSKGIAYSCLPVLVALYVVGAVSNGSLRHEVQTLPLWFPIVLGFRQRELAKWSALPCLFLWLFVVVSIWLFLLGWAHILTGHFTPIEIAMTVLIGIACVFGISQSFRWKTSVRPALALGILILFVALQLLAFKVSLDPYIATR